MTTATLSRPAGSSTRAVAVVVAVLVLLVGGIVLLSRSHATPAPPQTAPAAGTAPRYQHYYSGQQLSGGTVAAPRYQHYYNGQQLSGGTASGRLVG